MMASAGLGEIRRFAQKEISLMGGIPLDVKSACGKINLSGNGVWHI
jgi:hypothetical protein